MSLDGGFNGCLIIMVGVIVRIECFVLSLFTSSNQSLEQYSPDRA